MMGIPNEHQLTFNDINNAKLLKRDSQGMMLQRRQKGIFSSSNMKTLMHQVLSCLIKPLTGFKSLLLSLRFLEKDVTRRCKPEVTKKLVTKVAHTSRCVEK